MKRALLVTALCLASCGRSHDEDKSDLQEAINPRNDVKHVDEERSGDLQYLLSDLPTSGSVTKTVWTGNYYPSSQGGTKSAMLQYDRAFATGGKAASWEEQASSDQAGINWSGHCNGLAAAGINTPEPKRSVTYNNVSFSVEQVKALLIEAYQGTEQYRVVGGRCVNPTGVDADGRSRDAWCRDLNPGALHLALANFIGKMSVPVVLDIENGVPVWNYPAVAFSASVSDVTAEKAQSLITGNASAYTFNPDAREFKAVTLSVRLVTNQVLNLTYVLELNDAGAIIGGEWTGSSKAKHPDFVWRATKPSPENPNLDVEKILTIAQLSY